MDAAKFVESYSYKEKAIVYGLTGGIAEYLTFFNDNVELKTNIINNFLKTSGRLFEEATNLLKQELRQPKTYNDILFAIAGGASKLNEIATKLNMQTGGLTYYINSLVELGIVEKKTPVLDRKNKRPVYVIKDTMFRFWYYFVQKNMNLINMELGEMVYDKQVKTRLNEYMGSVFEKITIEYFEQRLRKGKLNFIPTDYGNWWGNDKIKKKESEIDLLAYDENNNYLFAEVKWKNKKADEIVLNELIEKSMNFGCLDRHYWLISLSGFEENNEYDGVELIDINDIYEV